MVDINKDGFDAWVINKLKSDPKLAKGYVKEAIRLFDEDEDVEILLACLSKAAKAMGWTKLEKETGISRQALYNALSKTGNPRIKTFLTIINALGYHMKIV